MLTMLGFYNYTGATGNLTVTNAYGLVINNLNEYGATTDLTLTNRWGIYQAGSSDINYFNANTLFGTTTNAGYKVDVSGTARVTQSAYFATASGNVGIGTTSPSSGYELHVFSAQQGDVLIQGLDNAVRRASLQLDTQGGSWTIENNSDLTIKNAAAGAGITTGCYFIIGRLASGYLSAGTNGSERMRIFANGNVRIASSFTDSGYLFQVGGNYETTGPWILSGSPGGAGGSVRYIGAGGTSNSWFYNIPTGGTHIFARNELGIVRITTDANLGIVATQFGGGTNTMAIESGTSPTSSPPDCFLFYSKDITAGNAAAHFRTENGAIVKVYQETTAVGSATVSSPGAGSTIKTDDTFDGYTLQQVVKALRNQGLLA
jgi:hypothetical protein